MSAELTEQNAEQRMNAAIGELPDSPYTDFAGYGIVICAGGEKYLTNAWVCINMLRNLQCPFPIELWHLGPREMSDAMRRLLEPLLVTCVDALEVRARHPVRRLNGWELKPFSIMHSRFRYVLSLDADNVPVVNPAFLFETPSFQNTGVLFWPGARNLGASRAIWRLTGVPYRDEPEVESGQIVIDKTRCWKALGLTMWMNEHSDFWYSHIHGDKETFHMAWRKLEQDYAMPRRGPQPLPRIMCQYDFAGRRIFQHRTQSKWTLASRRSISGFLFEDLCQGFLDTLRRDRRTLFGITRFAPAGKSLSVLQSADRLIQSACEYVRIGYDRRAIEFRPDGTIGLGSAERERTWNLFEAGGQLVFEIQSASNVTCRLELHTDGVWRGRWEAFEKMPVEIHCAPHNP